MNSNYNYFMYILSSVSGTVLHVIPVASIFSIEIGNDYR